MPEILHFVPLPPEANRAAVDGIVNLGFAREAVLPEFRFSAGIDATATANALAFAHPVQRTPAEYAAFSVFNHANGETSSRVVEVLSRSGALFHLLHRDGRFGLWASTYDNDTARGFAVEENISYDGLREALHHYIGDFRPERIIDVKQGRDRFRNQKFRRIQPSQLALWAIDVTRPVLDLYFTRAADVLRAAQEQSQAWTGDQTTHLAVQLLGLVILADTGVLGKTARIRRDLPLEELWTAGSRVFKPYFDEIPAAARPAAERALSILRDVSYAGFEPEMLIELYTQAYTPEQRKQHGRYDTPMYVTRRIWDHIPVELLEPERRLVCDMTVGWGSFLIAAHERLVRLSDMKDRSLVEHIVGNDYSASAAELARFGLLLSTSRDSWKVDAQDAFEWEWLKQHRPGVIVGNPPYKGSRKDPQPDQGSRFDRAVAFVNLAIERLAPEGFLGLVLPRSFLDGEAWPAVRQRLHSNCDLLEVWELPREVFRDTDTATAAIVARKNAKHIEPGPRPVVVRGVYKNTLPDFKGGGPFARTAVIQSAKLWTEIPPAERQRTRSKNTHKISYNLVLTEGEWADIQRTTVALKQRADIFQGCIKSKNPAELPPKPYASWKIQFLPDYRTAVPRPYSVDYTRAVSVDYPADFVRERWKKRHLLAAPKVLTNSVANPAWARRLTAVIERRGYFPSDNFWVFVPTPEAVAENVNLEVLAAVLGWVVANGWVVGFLRHTKIPRVALDTLPFPVHISVAARDEITRAVRRLETAAEAASPAPAEALATIDQLLQELYGISDETLQRLRRVTTGELGPEDLDPVPNEAATWLVDGSVKVVNSEANTITLRLNGFRELQKVDISAAMPGWLLRPGVRFRTSVTRDVWDSRRLSGPENFGQFTVMPYSYLDETELLSRLAELQATP